MTTETNTPDLTAVGIPVDWRVRQHRGNPASLTATLLQAAQLLEREAASLHECHTLHGRWQADNFEVRTVCEEMRDVAAQLRQDYNYLAANPIGGPAKAVEGPLERRVRPLCAVCGRPPHPCDDPECVPATAPVAAQRDFLLGEVKRLRNALAAYSTAPYYVSGPYQDGAYSMCELDTGRVVHRERPNPQIGGAPASVASAVGPQNLTGPAAPLKPL